ncbi:MULTISPECIES: formate/nitrite transporter family protein [Bacillus]|uniref:formate/nitrite transporter family protein n=1 Tax=Bacillus TaxID=1386 RepID=UPI00040975D5|nr:MULTISPECIES: formate/nitrite transporter family protein [Bacillus]QHZ45122.1 formate/nitrite transporter family protein [Bacillus sp. NSP9.1]WFA05084.1 formate/nitrite transporter family protein [Bacillus sp. HSf4]
METKSLIRVEELALKKYGIFEQSRLHYLLRSILASMFIGFGVIVAFKTGNLFYLEGSPFTYPIAAVTFGGAIILIVYGGGDLFTGNTFYYTFAALRKKMRWTDVIKMWIFSYAGNLMGAVLFATIIFASGLLKDSSSTGFLLSVAEHKMNTPAIELFFKAILCNWLVCLAFFVPMSQKGDGAKMFSMMLFVFTFFISGYEHSIANMATFAVALVTDHPETISLAGAVHNIIPVTLGNLVGGAFMMGFMYNYANKPEANGEEIIKKPH